MDSTLIPIIAFVILLSGTWGWFIGLLTPFAIKWLARVAARAELKIKDMRHQQSVLHGKTPTQPKPSLQAQPTTS